MKQENEIVISENIGLVHSCVKRFVGRGIEYDDLFQTGCVGLVKAAMKFDKSRGCQFSTYAVPVIIGEIKGLFRYGGPVKISRGLKEAAMKAAAQTQRFTAEFGRSPTLTELAELTGMSAEKIAEAIGASAAPRSLTFDEDDEERDIPTQSDEEKLTECISLWQTLEQLSDEDKKLISLRYFMNKTQKETAELIGSSQVQVSRREKKILLCMRGVLL
jgi:RNA polymerase sporulation-specific sigma factor